MTSAPRAMPRVMVSGLKPAPSMPLGTRMPTLSGGPDWSGMCRLPGREKVVGLVQGDEGLVDEGGDAGRDAHAHRPGRQQALGAHGQLHRSDGDVVLVVVTEIGG